ncbi:MAG: hypothetical protein NC548_40325 [Lachnospiraceae bacterium]|nr:hypothetical protein [Lachnospiraceae bacterium]
MSMDPLVPHILIEDEDYEIFTKLIDQINTDIRELIAVFPELVDVDNAPEIFLPKLSALIKYQYRYDIDEDVQREIIKRIISIYRDRGTDDSIIMAATYGNDPKWIGSHVFLPGANTDKDRATITHPINDIFRHNISRHSCGHRFADAIRWRDGTLIIHVSYIDDEIRAAIKKVVPAGLRVYFDIVSQSGGEGTEHGEVVFGEWKVIEFYEIDYSIPIRDRLEVALFDVNTGGRRLRSGRRLLFTMEEIEMYKGASMLAKLLHPEELPEKIVQVSKLRLTDVVKCIDSDQSAVYRSVASLIGYYMLKANTVEYPLPPEVVDTMKLIASFGFSTFSGAAKLSGPIKKVIDEENPAPVITSTMKALFDLNLNDYVYTVEIEDSEIEADYLNEIIHNIDYQIDGFYVHRYYKGVAQRSMHTGVRSKYGFSGSYTGEISSLCEIEDIIPSDRWYPVSAVEKLKLGEFLKNYCTPIQVDKYGRPIDTMFKDMNMHSGVSNGYEYRDLGSLRLIDTPLSPEFLLSTTLEVSEHIV